MRVAAAVLWLQLLRLAIPGLAKPSESLVSNPLQGHAAFGELPHAEQNSLMRREMSSEEAVEPGTQIKQKASEHMKEIDEKARASFRAIDMDKNGLLSMAEVDQAPLRSGVPEPHEIHEMLMNVDAYKNGGIKFKEFKKAMHRFHRRARSWKQLKHHHQKHATASSQVDVHPHSSGSPEETAEADKGLRYRDRKEGEYAEFMDTSGKVHVTTKTKTHTDKKEVSCGGHVAVSCEACTKTDADGSTTTDHGEEYCHGDCVYSAGVCKLAGTSSEASFNKMLNAENHGNLPQAGANPPTTTQLPDLKNPNMTAEDNITILNAAEAALKEEKREDEESEHEHGKKFPWKKFWLIIVIIMSIILGICCICSIVALITFNQVNDSGKKVEETAEEAEEGEEAEEEEEGDDGGDDASQ